MKPEQLAIEISRLANDNKCVDVCIMDLRGRSSVTDMFVICTGTSDRQIRSTADHILEHAKRLGERPFGVCGYDHAAWLLLDFVDVVIHIFGREQRSYYDLELLWGDAPRLDWSRSATA